MRHGDAFIPAFLVLAAVSCADRDVILFPYVSCVGVLRAVEFTHSSGRANRPSIV
jgi:hypothetical protein